MLQALFENRDALFVGFAGGLVTAVWVGRDDNQPLPGVAGGGLPASIWRRFNADAIGAGGRARAPRGRSGCGESVGGFRRSMLDRIKVDIHF